MILCWTEKVKILKNFKPQGFLPLILQLLETFIIPAPLVFKLVAAERKHPRSSMTPLSFCFPVGVVFLSSVVLSSTHSLVLWSNIFKCINTMFLKWLFWVWQHSIQCSACIYITLTSLFNRKIIKNLSDWFWKPHSEDSFGPHLHRKDNEQQPMFSCWRDGQQENIMWCHMQTGHVVCKVLQKWN